MHPSPVDTSSIDTALTNQKVPKSEIKETGKGSETKTSLPYLYHLFFRQGSNPHPQDTLFYHSSKDMRVVVERAKRFCENMNYRFTQVKPAIVDLDAEERKSRGQEGAE